MARKRDTVLKENKSDEAQGSNSSVEQSSSGSQNKCVSVYPSLKEQLAQLGLALREIPGDGYVPYQTLVSLKNCSWYNDTF